jgi:AcrR family transcriptional regulator
MALMRKNAVTKTLEHMGINKLDIKSKEAVKKKCMTNIKNMNLVRDKHRQIINASLKLFLSKGYSQTSVREIAKASDLTMGSLYNYINSKEDILFIAYNELVTLLHESIKAKKAETDDELKNFKDSLKAALDVMLNELGKYALIIYREGGLLRKDYLHIILEKEANFVKYFDNILLIGRKKGVFNIKDTYLISNIIVFLLVFPVMRKWNIKKYKDKEIIDGLIEFILKGIL